MRVWIGSWKSTDKSAKTKRKEKAMSRIAPPIVFFVMRIRAHRKPVVASALAPQTRQPRARGTGSDDLQGAPMNSPDVQPQGLS
ncbi:unnamed protein product [Bursaphelenchus okinawaensis]|uniref:Uncharacterized protein n=1 Tax=Bursaphelenchus okinawaensis TaxID=465554 RepID=A0A811KK19_9BILA|nr:unnamed protein product [Bursaphelenchus okinawaensis]CAG9104107.1 unnamed protein product [Bursaphelenchus okinawaensis]